tara:strand:+ start:1089 stop:1352 length:264 start_codon:yes stop_codon:yes gene_type:complete
MPVRQVGKDCYQWGNQKKYCGPNAKQKAILQGIAIENTGWSEAETVKFREGSEVNLSPRTRRGSWRNQEVVPIFCGMVLAYLTFRNR